MRWPSQAVLCLAVAATTLAVAGCAGTGRLGGENEIPQMTFYTESYNLPSEKPDRSRLFVIVDVVYADLQFVRSKNGYFARFVSSIALVDEEGAKTLRDISRVIRVDKFVETASKKRAERIYEVFDLAPGNYELVITVTDQNSLSQGVSRRPVTVKDFHRLRLAVSDIFFFDHLPETLESPKGAIPTYLGSYPDTFYAVARLTARDPDAPIEVTYKLSVPAGQVLLDETYTHTLRENGNLIRVELRRDDLRVGRNRFQIEVRSGKARDQSTRFFTMRWVGIPRTVSSLEEAIEQLRYVAPPEEWQAMLKAEGEEKKRLFEGFWKRRDPTPGTPENELEEEYYTRVAEANERYSEGARPGWQTDRGRIYILYGPPDFVTHESSERDLSTHYEIWHYQRLGQRFIFRDTGGGRFILVGVR